MDVPVNGKALLEEQPDEESQREMADESFG